MTNKERSKDKNWDSGTNIEAINSGSFQRIADACELMANNYAQLISERDRYKEWYRQEIGKVSTLENRIKGYRGVITKLKKKINNP